MARLVIYALAALATARAYDWTTPDAGLTPFNCTAFPNPIQVLKAAGQSPPYNVSELDLATGEYTKVCPNGFPTNKEVNGFALMQYPGTGPQPSLADNVYGFVCQKRNLQRFDCDSISQVDGNLVQQGNDEGKTCNAATFVGSTYYYTNGLQGANNQIYLVSGVDTDAPDFQPRGDALFNVSDKVLRGAENDITSLAVSLEEATTGSFTELINDALPGRKYVVGLAEAKATGPELFVARLEESAPGTPEAYAVLYTACSNVDWSLRPKNSQPPTPGNGCLRSTFGAAYTYDERKSSSASLSQPPRLFFSNNGGYGLFEVIIPAGGIPLPEGRDGCWNSGDPTTPGNTHVSCGEGGDAQQGLSFELKWVAQSAETGNNDGSACPGIAAPVFPSFAPTSSFAPTAQPTTPAPSSKPTAGPTPGPTGAPTAEPSSKPTAAPSPGPTARPTPTPTVAPTAKPSPAPTVGPTTPGPTPGPTVRPTPSPSTPTATADPTATPTTPAPTTPMPSPGPTPAPTTPNPSPGPTAAPTTPQPSSTPTARPSSAPTIAPTTPKPSPGPTATPTGVPTAGPTAAPTASPTLAPTGVPTVPPSSGPTAVPTLEPTASLAPTRTETYAPTRMTAAPSYAPTTDTYAPSTSPTATAAPTGFVFRATDATICRARDRWLANPVQAAGIYGPIATWDTSRVTTMSCLFTPYPQCVNGASAGSCPINRNTAKFNDDISAWDTSSVTNMYGMFGDNSQFNQDISGWDTARVTTMAGMFYSARKFNQPLQSWDVSGLTGFIQGQALGPGLYEMFTKAVAFDQNLGWCVSNAVNPNPALTFSGARCGSYDCGVRTVADPATDC